MAIISVKEKHERRRSSVKDGQRSHTRVFLVTTDNIQNGPAAALNANDGDMAIPQAGAEHPSGDGTLVNNIEAEPHQDSGIHFNVTVEYGGEEDEESGGGGTPVGDDPTLSPVEISYGAAEATESYFLDQSPQPDEWDVMTYGPWQGRPVVNSAGEPFDNFLERDVSELVITIVSNEAGYDANAMELYSNTINAGPVLIDGVTFAPGTLKLSPITASRHSWVDSGGNADIYYRLTKTLKARRQGWVDRMIDTGVNELDYTGDEPPIIAFGEPHDVNLVPIMNGAGLRVSKPWPLNGKGKKRLRPDEPPAVLTFQPYRAADWSALKFI